MFKQAYGADAITSNELTDSLATFQRTLIANTSPFDQWMRGDANAMSVNQLIGMREFINSGCVECHSSHMFSDDELHVLGVAENNKRETSDKRGGNSAFRTPTLRNLSLTAPYMHNSVITTLREAVQFYDDPDDSVNQNVPSNTLDPDFVAIGDIEGERLNRIVDFLQSLDDDDFDKRQPSDVPSGLVPRGTIY